MNTKKVYTGKSARRWWAVMISTGIFAALLTACRSTDVESSAREGETEQQLAEDLTGRSERIVYEEQTEESIETAVDNPLEVSTKDIGVCRVYDSWMDFKDEPELSYVDAETYAVIKDAYSNIEFGGKFETGEEEYFDAYIEKYWRLLSNEEWIVDRNTSTKMSIAEVDGLAYYIETYGIDNLVYYYFDVDGDSFPELCIQYYGMGIYVFDYNQETEEFSLWYDLASYNYTLIGTQKIMWRGNGKFLAFYELNEKGEEECQTFFWNEPYSEEINICIVMLPCYLDEPKDIVVTDKMKAQGIYAQSEERWYFRVTEQQYNELAENYREAYHAADEMIKEVTYTYEELFGSCSSQ